MISELVEMLGYCRPAFSVTEEIFIRKFLEPLEVNKDSYGNVWKVVGDSPPTIMWSSHTDTVHHKEGRVPVWVDGNVARVDQMYGGSCLGADCTTGVWIMMEMIRAEIPGLYVFHRAEEVGCLGSEHILKNYPKLLAPIQACIAFDRYGTDSVITHQMGEQGTSEAFTKSMIAQLPGYQADDGGSFTDSYTYFGVISECTNISVGYYSQHGRNEHQNLSFAQQLRDWMVNFDVTKLVFARDPSIKSYAVWDSPGRSNHDDDWMYGSTSWRPEYATSALDYSPVQKDKMTLSSLVEDYPEAAADLLEMCGFDTQSFLDHVNGSF